MVFVIDIIGAWLISFCTEVGTSAIFLGRMIKTLFTSRLKIRKIFSQMEHIGVNSSAIIILTSLSSGIALALQSYAGLSRIGGEEMVGVVVAWGMTRELGPVLTAIMVTGRAGSSMAAELGTMQITEQIDALRTLRINPYQYLIIPRIIAGTFILPFLTMFAMFFGILGGYLYTFINLTMNPESYFTNIQGYLVLGDIVSGLIKSFFFGFILSFVGAYKGFFTTGGARGVGRATTESVVVGCILILITNYFLSALLFRVGL